MRRFLLLSVTLCVLAAPAGGDALPSAWSEAARYEFEYRVAIPDRTPGRIAVWIPYPADNGGQSVLDATVQAPFSWRLTQEKRFGNRIAYFEGTAPLKEDIVLRFLVERRPYRGIPRDAAVPGTPLDPVRYLEGDALIPLDGAIRRLAEREGKGLTTPDKKARAFYDYVFRTMTYKKEGTRWGRGDAIWACNARYGNCTDFHSLFIGMARSAGIPARFVIGFPIPRDKGEGPIPGYHCWAEYFDLDRGWTGVDASEAWKSRRPDDYFGVLPNDRIEFTVGRDLLLEPPQRGEALNYFIYPYVELNGRPLPEVSTHFHFRRVGAQTGS